MSKTILIIDDSAAIRQMVRLTLSEGGYDVVEAGDGVEALAKLDGRKIRLVVCDVNMPNMDGIAFLKAFKQLPDYRFTPVIMLTTEASEASKLQGQAAGAKAWMVKPFQPEQLLSAVGKLIML